MWWATNKQACVVSFVDCSDKVCFMSWQDICGKICWDSHLCMMHLTPWGMQFAFGTAFLKCFKTWHDLSWAVLNSPHWMDDGYMFGLLCNVHEEVSFQRHKTKIITEKATTYRQHCTERCDWSLRSRHTNLSKEPPLHWTKQGKSFKISSEIRKFCRFKLEI